MKRRMAAENDGTTDSESEGMTTAAAQKQKLGDELGWLCADARTNGVGRLTGGGGAPSN